MNFDYIFAMKQVYFFMKKLVQLSIPNVVKEKKRGNRKNNVCSAKISFFPGHKVFCCDVDLDDVIL